MKVLILSYHVPPDPAVGTLRIRRLVDAFARAGHEVELIGPRWEGVEDIGIAVHRVPRWRNPRELALALRDRVRRRGSAAAVGGHDDAGADTSSGWTLPAEIPAWKRFVVAMALMPDDHQGFILPAAFRAIRLIRSRKIDLLYTSGPPHSAHVAGLLAGLVTRVRWAAEFRDPWTDNAVQPRYARSDAAAAMKRWLERLTFDRADHLVAVTEAAGRRFAERVPSAAERVIVARNGIDPVPAAAPPRRDDPVRVVYIGNLYHGRDPRPFMRAVAALLQGGEIARDRLRIDFFGDCDIYRGGSVRRMTDELGLGDVLQLHGRVPQPEALRQAATAHVLLLLAQDQPLQVPNKLYEYLGSQRPILAFADTDGETTAMLEQVGGHFVVAAGDPEEKVREVVRRALYARDWRPPASAAAVLADWSATHQMNALVAALAAGGCRSAALDGVRSFGTEDARPRDTLLHPHHASGPGRADS